MKTTVELIELKTGKWVRQYLDAFIKSSTSSAKMVDAYQDKASS